MIKQVDRAGFSIDHPEDELAETICHPKPFGSKHFVRVRVFSLCSEMPPKRRPTTSYLDPMALSERLAPIAALRDPGFLWTGESYSSHKRGLAPSHSGLALHGRVLREILLLSRTLWLSGCSLRVFVCVV